MRWIGDDRYRDQAPDASMSAGGPGSRRSTSGIRGAESADPGPTGPTDPATQAREVCLKLLTVRPRSRAELAEALRRKAIPRDVAESVLDRLGDVGLVDDAAVAEAAVHAGLTYRGLGRNALSAELRRRGVADDVALEAISAIDPEDEEQRARDLVRRRLRNTATGEDTAGWDTRMVRRLAAMLARKGYSEGLALRVIRDELGSGGWPVELERDPD